MGRAKRSRGRDRSRMLLQPQQRSTQLAVLRPEVGPELPLVRPQLLVEFTRALVRMHPSEDVIILCLGEAQHRSGADDEEATLMLQALLHDVASQTSWPKGFF